MSKTKPLQLTGKEYLQQAETVIAEAIDVYGISKTQVAIAVGVHRVTLIRQLKDVGKMPVSVFTRVLDVLGIDPFTLKMKNPK